jgi:hypothetical protein
MANRLTPEQWQSIRTIWEYNPDEPALTAAAAIAGNKHGFSPPTKQSLSEHAKKNGWERKGSMAGINQAAHRRADALVNPDGSERDKPDRKPDPSGPIKEAAAREESVDARSEVLARHRTEWKQVAVLRQEALQVRATDPDRAFARAKLAKITAEMTKIQQEGERKAWGLDDLGDFDPSRMTDEQLERIIRGG